MRELTELIKLSKINAYLSDLGSQERQLTMADNPSLKHVLVKRFRTEEKLLKRKEHLECKLTAESIVIATKKAEIEVKKFVDNY